MEDACVDLQWVCDSVWALRRKKKLLREEIDILNLDVDSATDEAYYALLRDMKILKSQLRMLKGVYAALIAD